MMIIIICVFEIHMIFKWIIAIKWLLQSNHKTTVAAQALTHKRNSVKCHFLCVIATAKFETFGLKVWNTFVRFCFCYFCMPSDAMLSNQTYVFQCEKKHTHNIKKSCFNIIIISFLLLLLHLFTVLLELCYFFSPHCSLLLRFANV